MGCKTHANGDHIGDHTWVTWTLIFQVKLNQDIRDLMEFETRKSKLHRLYIALRSNSSWSLRWWYMTYVCVKIIYILSFMSSNIVNRSAKSDVYVETLDWLDGRISRKCSYRSTDRDVRHVRCPSQWAVKGHWLRSLLWPEPNAGSTHVGSLPCSQINEDKLSLHPFQNRFDYLKQMIKKVSLAGYNVYG